jgi:hypothetical protein
VRHPESILHKKCSGIHPDFAAFGIFYLKAADHGLGKGFLHRLTLVWVFTFGPVVVVGLDHQYFGAPTDEFYYPTRSQFSPVESQVIGTDPSL